MTGKRKSIAAELRRRMHDPIGEMGEWLQQVVRGYYNYHAVPGNLPRMSTFRRAIARYWWRVLRRRSQRCRRTWGW